jgi:hypothetical protein
MESAPQTHERLLRIIEDNTRGEGLEPAHREKLESLVRALRPRQINEILRGTIYTFYDPGTGDLRSRTGAN